MRIGKVPEIFAILNKPLKTDVRKESNEKQNNGNGGFSKIMLQEWSKVAGKEISGQEIMDGIESIIEGLDKSKKRILMNRTTIDWLGEEKISELESEVGVKILLDKYGVVGDYKAIILPSVKEAEENIYSDLYLRN